MEESIEIFASMLEIALMHAVEAKVLNSLNFNKVKKYSKALSFKLLAQSKSSWKTFHKKYNPGNFSHGSESIEESLRRISVNENRN